MQYFCKYEYFLILIYPFHLTFTLFTWINKSVEVTEPVLMLSPKSSLHFISQSHSCRNSHSALTARRLIFFVNARLVFKGVYCTYMMSPTDIPLPCSSQMKRFRFLDMYIKNAVQILSLHVKPLCDFSIVAIKINSSNSEQIINLLLLFCHVSRVIHTSN